MQKSRVKEIMKKAAVIPNIVKFDVHRHKEQDFAELYRFLVRKYEGYEDCPALLLLDECVPKILCDENGYEAVILNRASDDLKRDLKNIIRKPGVLTNVDTFDTIWCPETCYRNIYNLVLDICNLLKIPAPAVFMSKKMPKIEGISKTVGGMAIPGDDLVTDVIVQNTMDTEGRIVKALAHELRHVWQHKYHNSWFDDYSAKKRGEEYALQKAEVDAEAFAYLYMEQYGNYYILSDLGETIYKALSKRMDEIRGQKLFVDYHPIFLE